MRNVVIVAAARTPIGTIGGQFKTLTSLDLSIPVMQGLVERAGINPEIIEDVIWGCNYQRTYKENNLARVAAVKAGLPVTVPGITIHRNCTSSMSSIQFGFYQIMAGEAECIMAGGADSMSTAPHMVFDARYGKKYGHMEMRDSMWDSLTNLGVGPAMGITAENVADEYNVTREEMDAYSLRSQQRAVAAIDAGKFKDEIVPVVIHNKKKGDIVIDTDEHPIRNCSYETISKMKAVFTPDGVTTAANASGINDAAAAVIVMSADKAKELGIKPMAKMINMCSAGVEPKYMGIGPAYAIPKCLKGAGMDFSEVDYWEINEAFAAQFLGVGRKLKEEHGWEVDLDKTNANGSGISLGHPIGCTGLRIIVSMLYEMERRGATVGGGPAMASLWTKKMD